MQAKKVGSRMGFKVRGGIVKPTFLRMKISMQAAEWGLRYGGTRKTYLSADENEHEGSRMGLKVWEGDS